MSICHFMAPRHVNMSLCGPRHVNISTCQYVNMSICGTKTSKYLDFFAREALRSHWSLFPRLTGRHKNDHFGTLEPTYRHAAIPTYRHRLQDIKISKYLRARGHPGSLVPFPSFDWVTQNRPFWHPGTKMLTCKENTLFTMF